MKGECLICKAPLVYPETGEEMECAICGRKEFGRARCERGHYVCDECHMAGLDAIVALCLESPSKNPADILEGMMAMPFCHMHGPEHHVMVGAALLTAYRNAGGEIDLERALTEMVRRGKSVPGGACGFWGACGAGISSGMFVSILSSSTPLSAEPFALAHQMTAKSLNAIGEIGGPRCCKRDSYLSVLAAVDFAAERFGIQMEKPEIVCRHSPQNNQCIGKRCPFSSANRRAVSGRE
ncbi:MAG: SAM-dependent methyltransferase [Clostridia bacterium]|nr:SAM-dependent methyltransferase [Clostridia bacterium]